MIAALIERDAIPTTSSRGGELPRLRSQEERAARAVRRLRAARDAASSMPDPPASARLRINVSRGIASR
jgi:hypothetical protein